MQPIQSKQIKILSLDSKQFNGANGPWTKYNIKADDNQFYGTTDSNWFANRKVGETLVIDYYSTVPVANKFGKMVSYNNIVTTSQNQLASTTPATNIPQEDLASAIMQLINLVKKSEANIIDAIRLHCGSEIEGIETVEPIKTEKRIFGNIVKIDEDEIPVVEDENNIENPF